MIKGDIFTSPIDFALQETMKKFENDEQSRFIYESLRRSKVMWENIRINGIEIVGLTYEQFCDQFENKKNVVFLSDDEVKDLNKAFEIMRVMRK